MTCLVLCCHDCCVGLVELGAVANHAPRMLSLGAQCEVHPSSRHAQASNAVDVELSTLAVWKARVMASPPSSPSSAPAEGWERVADLATLILARDSNEAIGEDSILVAVQHARRIVAAAKGGV